MSYSSETPNVALLLDTNKLSTDQIARINNSELKVVYLVRDTFPVEDISANCEKEMGKIMAQLDVEQTLDNVSRVKNLHRMESST